MYILGAIRQSICHNPIGGMELVTHDLYKGLVESGHRVEVLTSSIDKNLDSQILDGVKYIFIKNAPPGVYSSTFHEGILIYLDNIVAHKNIPNIIHSASVAAKSVSQNRYNIPVIATWHGTNIEQELDKMMFYSYIEGKNLLPVHCQRLLENLFGNKDIKETFQCFDGHVAISSFMNKCIEFYGIKNNKIKTIQNALPDYFFEKNKQSLSLNIPKNKKIIGIVGRVVPMKGHDFFTKVIQKIDTEKYEVLLIGSDVVPKIYENLNVKIHTFKLDRISMPSVYSMMDIFINPTFRYSGFDLTVQEALASGTVVLSSDIKPYQDYYDELQDKFGNKSPFYVFRVGDVDSCANAINRIIVNNIRNEQTSYFCEQFKHHRMIKCYLEFFNRFLDKE